MAGRGSMEKKMITLEVALLMCMVDRYLMFNAQITTDAMHDKLHRNQAHKRNTFRNELKRLTMSQINSQLYRYTIKNSCICQTNQKKLY